jgi:hypothetical protein
MTSDLESLLGIAAQLGERAGLVVSISARALFR